MSAKHTPGPWRYYTEPQPNGCPIVGNGQGLMVAMLAHSTRQPEQREEALANARLIAAAPELLEAIIAARKLWGDYLPAGNSNAMKAMKLVDAAIAKATGQDAQA